MPLCYLLFYAEIKITGQRQDYIIMYINLNYSDSEDFILPPHILIHPFKCDLARLSLLIVCFILFFFFFFPPVTVTVEGRSTLCLCSSGRWVDPTRPNCCYRYQLLGWKKKQNKKKQDMSYLLAVYQMKRMPLQCTCVVFCTCMWIHRMIYIQTINTRTFLHYISYE